MNLNSLRSFVGAAVLLGVFSGCGPAWKVVRVSGPPSALAGATDLAVAFDYGQMVVEGKPEADWVAAKTAEDANYPTTWADLKGKFEAAVMEGVQSQVPSAHRVEAGVGNAVMVVQMRDFKLGKFIPFYQPPTVMNGNLVFQVGGQGGDEINLVRSYPASITQPSVFNHIGHVGRAIGTAGGQFFNNATGK